MEPKGGLEEGKGNRREMPKGGPVHSSGVRQVFDLEPFNLVQLLGSFIYLQRTNLERGRWIGECASLRVGKTDFLPVHRGARSGEDVSTNTSKSSSAIEEARRRHPPTRSRTSGGKKRQEKKDPEGRSARAKTRSKSQRTAPVQHDSIDLARSRQSGR